MRTLLALAIVLLLSGATVAAPVPSPTPTASPWTGDYKWDEVVPDSPSVMWQYRMRVYQVDKTLVADINIDGFQTKTRLQASCDVHGDKLSLRFEKYREGLNDGNYRRGHTLLTLRHKGDRLVTDWIDLEPQFRDNRHSGEYFEKVSQNAN